MEASSFVSTKKIKTVLVIFFFLAEFLDGQFLFCESNSKEPLLKSWERHHGGIENQSQAWLQGILSEYINIFIYGVKKKVFNIENVFFCDL